MNRICCHVVFLSAILISVSAIPIPGELPAMFKNGEYMTGRPLYAPLPIDTKTAAADREWRMMGKADAASS
ncbi:uncharacterized protein STEHIDRAFT_159757 [Stereum hirsutum FP-91666 SS1]|uniref:uncharacterized protein n=1 Tax=Stereum hirsutum (strain FP-91666) TaxID=721885 RepID=UPI00044495C3|nr:uncharacterized protein STEHIDRAFT_159757 [Stereum hirsutum FP-91666 SS1]EIM84164.1 hypothetical protein STEHIDRAFT_159757 [Stereum hirsutum FP-91666 SS1]